ncbi:MAG: iron uptake porin [Cyanobacteria bacterium P01_H01_bin.15]
MSNRLDISIKVLGALAAGTLVGQAPAHAEGVDSAEVFAQVEQYAAESQSTDAMEQVQSVGQLTDVSPGDWAFEALTNLVERYGCIEGYPNRTFRGNRATTRYEFAAGLNACLNSMERLIANSEAVLREDIAALQRLIQEFEAELAALGARVDSLEGRVAFLEDHQFSTTTKLAGEVVFGVAGVLAGDDINGDDIDRNWIFSDRVRLEFNTSFTGKDLLFLRLATGNTPNLLQGTTPEGALGYEQDEGNDIGVEVLEYSFPVGDNLTVLIGPQGVATDDFTPTINFLDGDGGAGAISAFGTRSSIYYPPEGAGIGFDYQFSEAVGFAGGYLAADGGSPAAGDGLFNGAYGAIAQLTVTPTEDLAVGLTYTRGYNVEFGTGSNRANPRSFLDDTAIESNTFGLEFSWQVADSVVIGGWGAYSSTNLLSGDFDGDDLDIWTWAATLAFPDLLKEGSVGGIIVGMEPKVTSADSSSLEDEDTSIHIEGFYEFKLNDNIAITPGIIWLTSPDHNSDNDSVVEGVIRTTFTF